MNGLLLGSNHAAEPQKAILRPAEADKARQPKHRQHHRRSDREHQQARSMVRANEAYCDYY